MRECFLDQQDDHADEPQDQHRPTHADQCQSPTESPSVHIKSQLERRSIGVME